MELKQFSEYSLSEKKELLIHWWHYYGKVMYTLEEMNQFRQMIEENCDQVMMMAIFGYVDGITSQPIIAAMRAGKLEELKSTLPKPEEQDDKFKEVYSMVEAELIKELVKTYNNPEPSVPML